MGQYVNAAIDCNPHALYIGGMGEDTGMP